MTGPWPTAQRPRHRAITLSLGILVASAIPDWTISAAPQTVRDARPAPAAGTSVIAGRVVTSDNAAAPIRRARVVVTSTSLEITRSTLTGDDGAFVLGGLPAGRYTVSASKPGMLRMSYGATRPVRPGTAVSVAAGQKIADIVIPMTRGGVVTGLVTDEHGRPARGVPMRIQEARTIAGERVVSAVNITPGTAGEKTDDRGEFRLFGLPPGEYIVSAMPDDDSGGLTRAAGGGTVGYVPVYYPGTTVAADARTVTVKAGEDAGGIDFRLQRVRTARIEGSIGAPEGAKPQDVMLTLVPMTTAAADGSYMASVMALRALTFPTANWKFSYAGVAPGRYLLSARLIERPAAAGAGGSPSALSTLNATTLMWAAAELTIDGVDRSDVALALKPGMTLSGRVQFQAAPGSVAPDFAKVRVSLSSAARGAGAIAFGGGSVTPDAKGQFTIRGVIPGKYSVRASVAGPPYEVWAIASSVVGGRDTLDFPIEIGPDEHVTNAVLTLTEVRQRLSGMLQDAAGRPASAFTIVLFPADRSYWGVTRRIRTARPGQDGRYTINDVPVGEYRVAAVYDLSPGETSDPSFLETLVAGSVPLTIRSGERKVQDFRIAR